MKKSGSILIIEDEMVIAANIALQLTKLGYEISGIVPRGEEALNHLRENPPDIVLVDINLKGTLDGVETVKQMQKDQDIPVIYLTANADEVHFNRAKETKPFAFISKPFKNLDLQRAIELAMNHLNPTTAEFDIKEVNTSPYLLTDSIFVRHQEKMLKILISDILYIEAERNYCRIHTTTKEHLLVMTLKTMNEKLPQSQFMRVHRSFIININQVREVGGKHVVINHKAIPFNKTSKELLLQRLQTI